MDTVKRKSLVYALSDRKDELDSYTLTKDVIRHK